VSLQSADVAAIRAAAGGPRSASGDRPVRVLSVGRLVPDKNVAALVEAFARAGLDGGEAQLQIVGTGPLLESLRALAERLGVTNRVDFAGYLAPEQLPLRYAAADVFALVSTWEPFGVAVREAAAAGLPLLCSRLAGAAGDVAIEGRNALLVDPHDLGAIASGLRRLCREPELRAALGRASWELEAARSIDADVEAFERAVLCAGRTAVLD
jgi:glycosyltransferase involved in cell wall biosynthesis